MAIKLIAMPRKIPGPPCQVCSAPSVAKGLCDKHYRKLKKFGEVDKTLRPDDWGQRSKHPLWHTWKWTGRTNVSRCKRWDDFWTFVEDVGERPNLDSKLKRRNLELPFSPENCYWSEPVEYDREALDARAAYMRAWHKKNPVKTKTQQLRKMFGIGMEQYTQMLEQQNGKCAVCGMEDQWFSLAVDHCHDKKHIRGLLCSQCNRGIGLFKDDPERLRNAAAYLEKSTRLI